LNKDNPHILQQQVCYLSYGSGNFFVDCSTPEMQNAFVDKVIEDFKTFYKTQQDNVLNVAQKNINDTRKHNYNPYFHENSRVKTMPMANESEKSHINTVQKSTNIEVDLITDMLDWIKNSPQSIYALLGDYGMGKTFSCRIHFAFQG
jgi:hypothetical protein